MSIAAQADMRVDRAIVYFEPDKPPRQDIVVSNLDDEDLFLQVEVIEVHNPGRANEKRTVVRDLDKIGFIASPVKSIVAPQSRRLIRLINLKEPSNQEKIYRVTFKPVASEFEANRTILRLLVAYQSLVIVRPENPTVDVVSTRSGDVLTLKNRGNANVYLQDGVACAGEEWREEDYKNLRDGKDEAKKKDLEARRAKCSENKDVRLYAGNSIDIDMSGGKEFVRYTFNYSDKHKTKIFR